VWGLAGAAATVWTGFHAALELSEQVETLGLYQFSGSWLLGKYWLADLFSVVTVVAWGFAVLCGALVVRWWRPRWQGWALAVPVTAGASYLTLGPALLLLQG
jgi:hypothetical protein